MSAISPKEASVTSTPREATDPPATGVPRPLLVFHPQVSDAQTALARQASHWKQRLLVLSIGIAMVTIVVCLSVYMAPQTALVMWCAFAATLTFSAALGYWFVLKPANVRNQLLGTGLAAWLIREERTFFLEQMRRINTEVAAEHRWHVRLTLYQSVCKMNDEAAKLLVANLRLQKTRMPGGDPGRVTALNKKAAANAAYGEARAEALAAIDQYRNRAAD